MLELIRYIVEQFAEHPDKAQYLTEENGNNVTVTVVLEPSDMGKVIGRQGKVAKALRTLVKTAAAKEGKRYNVEIKEAGEME